MVDPGSQTDRDTNPDEKLMRSHYTRAMRALPASLWESLSGTPSLDPCVPSSERTQPFNIDDMPHDAGLRFPRSSVRDAVSSVRSRLSLLRTCEDIGVARVLIQQTARKIGLALQGFKEFSGLASEVLLPILRAGLVLPFLDVGKLGSR